MDLCEGAGADSQGGTRALRVPQRRARSLVDVAVEDQVLCGIVRMNVGPALLSLLPKPRQEQTVEYGPHEMGIPCRRQIK